LAGTRSKESRTGVDLRGLIVGMTRGDQASEDALFIVDGLRKLHLFGLGLIPQEEVVSIRHRPLRTVDVCEPLVLVPLSSATCDQ
jgi:hypothetical protein